MQYIGILEEIKFGDLTMFITTHACAYIRVPKQLKKHYNNIIVIVTKNNEELFKAYFTNGMREVNKMKIIDQVNATLLNKSLGLH